MGKYTDQAKLAAVRDCCSGEAGMPVKKPTTKYE